MPLETAKKRAERKFGSWLTLLMLLSAGVAAVSLLQDCQFGQHIAISKASGLQPAILDGEGLDNSQPADSAPHSITPHAVTSNLSCHEGASPDANTVTPKELDLQQQRRCIADRPGWQPPGGYLAICVAVKNQHRDLPEWLDYHRRLGVSHVYVMDDHSATPLQPTLRPYIEEGFVTHRVMGDYSALQRDLLSTTCFAHHPAHKQLIVQALCLRDFGHRHRWMAFIDLDEFLVFKQDSDSADNLPALLREFEQYGGLTVNWRVFGSSGHKKRQPHTLPAYTDCYDREDNLNRHIKSIVQPRYTVRIVSPHHAAYAPGYFAVTTSGTRVEGPFTTTPAFRRLALHHYVVKSREEFEEKRERGSSMGNQPRDAAFWRKVEARATKTCFDGKKAWERLFGSKQPNVDSEGAAEEAGGNDE